MEFPFTEGMRILVDVRQVHDFHNYEADFGTVERVLPNFVGATIIKNCRIDTGDVVEVLVEFEPYTQHWYIDPPSIRSAAKDRLYISTMLVEMYST